MLEYASWRPIYRAMCPEPGPRDTLLLLFANGKRMGMYPVDHYNRLRALCEQWAKALEVQIKLLPVSGDEVFNFLGIQPGPFRPIDTMDPVERQQLVASCMGVMLEDPEPRIRHEAADLLRLLGAMQ